MNDSLNRRVYGVSCVQLIHKEVTIPLLPSAMGQELKAVESTLDSEWSKKYVDELNGFLVGYKNLEIVSDSGEIKNDLPFVFWQIKANFSVFRPQKGEIVEGEITKKTHSRVFCSVLGNIPSIVTRCESAENFVSVGRKILFKIEDSDFSLCVLKGTIDEECVQLMTEDNSFIRQHDMSTDQIGDENAFDDFFNDCPVQMESN